MISVVIPTYNEAAVIEQTLRRAAAALRAAGQEFELVVVDDASADGTAARAEALAPEIPVRVLKRPGRLGLATAVLDGWAMASGEVLGVIDADLQHPPEVLTALAAAVYEEGADLAIGSRYVPGGGTSDWTLRRRLISRTATHMAATVLPLRLAAVRDPMSGVFLLRRSILSQARLNPMGYKILLEVIAKAHYQHLVEVPYVFQEREHGSSKLGARQYLEYVAHLARLAITTGQLAAGIRYAAVALVGTAIDVGLVLVLIRQGWSPLVALPAAIVLALAANSLGNDLFTFSGARASRLEPLAGPPARREGLPPVTRRDLSGSPLKRALRYGKVCAPGAILNASVTLLFLSQGVDVLVSAAAGVVAGGVLNLLFNIPSIWRTWTL